MTAKGSPVLDVAVADRPSDAAVAIGWPVVAGTDPVELPAGLGRLRAEVLADRGFSAKVGQAHVLRPVDEGAAVVLLGLGPADGLDAERWRRAAAALVRAAGAGGEAALLLPDGLSFGVNASALGSAVAEGGILAAYHFDAYRTSPRPSSVDRLVVVAPAGQGDDRQALATGVARGSTAAAAAVFARDLINTPASDLPPWRLAERVAERLSDRPGLTVTVWDEDRITDERLGGVLGVARGSLEPPRFVRVDYEPESPVEIDGRVPHVVLVGKGVTFDSGGLSLKTPEGMTTMKTDMSGAAIVLSALSACPELGVRVRVSALAPMAENMPGARAVKPGDVLTIRNGLTVEVLTTDAEGRLILADALSLAAELAPPPDAVIDVATLTGSARIALGNGIAPLFGNDPALVDRVRAAGQVAGERLWPMPMPDDYKEHLESDVADLKNIGRAGQAGAVVAALFLARFVGDVPWAHLDIAGTGRSGEATGYLNKGGTAFGVRTLLAYLRSFSAPGTPE